MPHTIVTQYHFGGNDVFNNPLYTPRNYRNAHRPVRAQIPIFEQINCCFHCRSRRRIGSVVGAAPACPTTCRVRRPCRRRPQIGCEKSGWVRKGNSAISKPPLCICSVSVVHSFILTRSCFVWGVEVRLTFIIITMCL